MAKEDIIIVIGGEVIGRTIYEVEKFIKNPRTDPNNRTWTLSETIDDVTNPCTDILKQYILTSEYCIKHDRQKLELRIMNKKYKMKKICSDNNNKGFFYASLKGFDKDNIEAKIQFTKNTRLITLDIAKNNKECSINKIIYGKEIIYERK